MGGFHARRHRHLRHLISQTGTVYVSLDDKEKRVISLDPLNHKGRGEHRIPIFPVVFSRISGAEFVCVNLDSSNQVLTPESSEKY
jgi:hypothetical protein